MRIYHCVYVVQIDTSFNKFLDIHRYKLLIGWCGRVSKGIAPHAEGVGFKYQRISISNDELGLLVDGLTSWELGQIS